MDRLKKISLITLFFVLQSCAQSGGGATEAALTIVTLPLKIVGAAVGAAIGAASGMGIMPL